MIKAINNLAAAGADFVVVPCNSAHYWYDQIRPEISIPWLNMIAVVSEQCKQAKRPLILGGHVTAQYRLYSEYLPRAQYPDPAAQQRVEARIEAAKISWRPGYISHWPGDYDILILACTELHAERPAVNSLDLYARATVEHARAS